MEILKFLGMHFSQAVSIIQAQVGIIRGVQVLYSDTVSLLKEDGKHDIDRFYFWEKYI